MRYAEFLKENGTIAFVAPSFGCATEPYKTIFNNARRKITDMGFRVVLGPNCYLTEGVGKSNTPEKCGEEINEYYVSKDNDIMISCGGGELMCEDVDYFDFERIKGSRPKWYMGYSDNTNLTFLLTTICDTASVYGPHACAFGMEPWHESVQDALDVLMGKKLTVKGYDRWERESLKSEENPYATINVTEPKKLVIYNPDTVGTNAQTTDIRMSGRILVGCMDCLTTLIGTGFDKAGEFAEKYKEDGILWFLEACDYNTMDIRRSLWQMEHAGWFRYVKGFIFGKPYNHGSEYMGLNQYDAVTGILDKYKVPIVMDADIGHISPAMPVICGAYGMAETGNGNISVTYELR